MCFSVVALKSIEGCLEEPRLFGEGVLGVGSGIVRLSFNSGGNSNAYMQAQMAYFACAGLVA
jgi:hypothetical protein